MTMLHLLSLVLVPLAQQAPDAAAYVKPGQGQAELYALLNRHRERVLSLFQGHFHCGLRGWDDHAPLQEVIFPSALFNLDRRLAAQKVPGFHVQEFRPGFVLATLGPDGLALRYQPVDAADTRDKVCPLPQLRG